MGLDYSSTLKELQEATQKFGVLGTGLNKPQRWCRLLHVYTVIFLKAVGDNCSPLKFKSTAGGYTHPKVL